MERLAGRDLGDLVLPQALLHPEPDAVPDGGCVLVETGQEILGRPRAPGDPFRMERARLGQEARRLLAVRRSAPERPPGLGEP